MATPPRLPVFQNIKSFQVKSLYLESLLFVAFSLPPSYNSIVVCTAVIHSLTQSLEQSHLVDLCSV